MRTVAIQFSAAEHRVLRDLAAAQETSVSTLVRDALGLAPIDTTAPVARRLEVVRGSGPAPATGKRQSDAAPVS